MTAFLSSQLTQGDYSATTWRIRDAAPETSIETLLKPDSWSHCSTKLKQYDEVIVIPLGGPFRAHLIVMEAGKNFAKMRLLSVILLNETQAAAIPQADSAPLTLPANAPVVVKWNGPKDKYTVLRRADGEKLKTGVAIKAEAIDWALKHIASMAA